MFANHIPRNAMDIRLLKPSFINYLKGNYPGTIIYDGQAPAGSTIQRAYNRDVAGLADSALFPGAELLADGDMEAAGTTDWLSVNGTLSKEVANPHSGTQSLRMTYLATPNPQVKQAIANLTIGVRYITSGWVRGIASGNVRCRVQNGGQVLFDSNADDDTWQYYEIEFVATATFLIVFGLNVNGAGEWIEIDDMSIREANPLNADATGATPAQPFGGNIPLAWSYDGNNDFLDAKSAALDTAWNPTEWSIVQFARHDGIVGTTRRLFSFIADGSNFLVGAISVVGSIQVDYNAGGTTKTRSHTLPSPTDSFMLTVKRSAAGVLSLSINAATPSTIAGVGIWAGTFATAIIGAGSTTPTLPWNGLIAPTLLFEREVTTQEETDIGNRSGVY